jgi:hypothetical protein
MSTRVNALKPRESWVISNGDLGCHPIFTPAPARESHTSDVSGRVRAADQRRRPGRGGRGGSACSPVGRAGSCVASSAAWPPVCPDGVRVPRGPSIGPGDTHAPLAEPHARRDRPEIYALELRGLPISSGYATSSALLERLGISGRTGRGPDQWRRGTNAATRTRGQTCRRRVTTPCPMSPPLQRLKWLPMSR